MRAKRRPGETERQIEERLQEQIRTQHLEQLLGVSAIEADIYRQRLPRQPAARRPEETEQDVEKRLSEQLRGQHLGQPLGVGGKEIQIEKYAGEFWPHRSESDRNARFERLCHELLDERNIWRQGRERLIHYVCSRDQRFSYDEASRLVYRASGRVKPQMYRFTGSVEVTRCA